MILLAVDPGRTTGWAIFNVEKLVAFGQFAVADAADIVVCLHNIFEGWDGYPAPRTRVRPTLAMIEEASNHYHRTHADRGSRSVGEHAMTRSMNVNTACRRRVEAALLRLGVPSLGVSPEEWGARENVTLRARAELELAAIVIPTNFYIDHQEHARDAIALGGWASRHKPWEVK
jgi:hypothetical protein